MTLKQIRTGMKGIVDLCQHLRSSRHPTWKKCMLDSQILLYGFSIKHQILLAEFQGMTNSYQSLADTDGGKAINLLQRSSPPSSSPKVTPIYTVGIPINVEFGIITTGKSQEAEGLRHNSWGQLNSSVQRIRSMSEEKTCMALSR